MSSSSRMSCSAPACRSPTMSGSARFSHLEGATIASGAIVGPFARLRPGAVLERDVHVGNFVEVKETRLGAGAKASHLSYLGDSEVGAGTNIGAGTITCNYDGFNKHRTVIGRKSVHRVEHGAGAPGTARRRLLANRSVVIHGRAADGLTIRAGRQVDKPGATAELRERLREKETLMCGIIGDHRQEVRRAGAGRGASGGSNIAAMIRLGSRPDQNGRIERRRAEGQIVQTSSRATRPRAGAGHDRHRPYPLATQGQPIEKKRPPDRDRPGRGRCIKRHHRNFPGIEERADRARPFVPDRHRTPSGGGTGDLSPGAGVSTRRRRWRTTLDGWRAPSPRLPVRRPARSADLRPARLSRWRSSMCDGEMFVGSDALALAPLTRRIAYLEEGDWALGSSPRRRSRSSTAPTSRSNARCARPRCPAR